MTRELDLTADIIDVRDIIARVEELETIPAPENGEPDNASEELITLMSYLDDLRGNGGDEQWRGDWYPVTLIRDSYFKEYAQDLAEDIGAVEDGASWPNYCIDWDRAARELQFDYASVEIDGTTYWYR